MASGISSVVFIFLMLPYLWDPVNLLTIDRLKCQNHLPLASQDPRYTVELLSNRDSVRVCTHMLIYAD
jgi:hypothetical protein